MHLGHRDGSGTASTMENDLIFAKLSARFSLA